MKKHMVGLGVVLNLICMLMLVPLAMAQPVENFHAVLAGDNQVSPVDTRARGLVTFQLSKDRTKLEYKVVVANIQNVIGAHIHLAPEGANGPIVLSLLPDPAKFPPPFIPDPGVIVNGILVEGTAIGSDLAGQLAGFPLESLITEIKAGNAYVNVHTVANRPGEIRGQIE